jgi:hypothetical protein
MPRHQEATAKNPVKIKIAQNGLDKEEKRVYAESI